MAVAAVVAVAQHRVQFDHQFRNSPRIGVVQVIRLPHLLRNERLPRLMQHLPLHLHLRRLEVRWGELENPERLHLRLCIIYNRMSLCLYLPRHQHRPIQRTGNLLQRPHYLIPTRYPAFLRPRRFCHHSFLK